MNVGIDLGTYKTIVYIQGKGIVYNEPSVVAYDETTNRIIAIGKEAHKMVGKTPANIKTIRPILHGVICDYNFAEQMLAIIFKKIKKFNIFKPKIAICVPSIVTNVEKYAIIDVAVKIGARQVIIIDEPIAAALGEGLDITKPKGRLVIDIGGGSTDIALISLNGIVFKNSIRLAGDSFDDEVIKVLKDKYNFLIGHNTARKIKESIGTLYIKSKLDNLSILVNGKDGFSGMPIKREVFSNDFLSSFNLLANQIIDSVKLVIENSPPDILVDIQNQSVLLTGGGAKLNGLKEKLEKSIKLNVFIPKNCVESVALGTGNCFDYLDSLDDGLIKTKAYKK